jgi:hypothetical protein
MGRRGDALAPAAALFTSQAAHSGPSERREHLSYSSAYYLDHPEYLPRLTCESRCGTVSNQGSDDDRNLHPLRHDGYDAGNRPRIPSSYLPARSGRAAVWTVVTAQFRKTLRANNGFQ